MHQAHPSQMKNEIRCPLNARLAAQRALEALERVQEPSPAQAKAETDRRQAVR